MFYILIYLMSIVGANLLVAWLGPAFSVVNAFLFIGLDITSRDKLHEKWHKKNLLVKMLALIITGGIISFLLNRSSLMIAVASTISFLLASLVDFIVYSILYKKDFMVKSNASNIFSSIVDSFVFPTIAFGSFMPVVTLLQIIAKIGGGFVWSVVLNKFKV